jgi:preprotein translocase subunit SecD
VKGTRNLWLSILFVGALVVASLVGFMLGYRPILGLDLQGGVSVILSAPPGTPRDVMDQALENIRNRVDAFGAAEPLLFVSGNTIEVQIPGLARGTIREQAKEQFCLIGQGHRSYGCYPTQSEAQTALDAVAVNPVVESVCLTGVGDNAPCFGSQADADKAVKNLTVQPETVVSPAASPSGSPSASPSGSGPSSTNYCITGPDLSAPVCTYGTKAEAQAALDSVGTQATQQYCLQSSDGTTLESQAGSACFTKQADAQAALDAMSPTHETVQYCVESSAGKAQGCFLTRDDAQAVLQKTGQERLLQIIGTTARLEQRQVLGTLTSSTPNYDSTPVTCGTAAERQTSGCSFNALKDKNVVFLGKDGTTKYQLGPVLITGDQLKKATAIYDASGSTCSTPGWCVQFSTTSEGTGTLADVTRNLVGKQLAIVLDQAVISAPTVQSAITNGNGVITGSFSEQRAKDLATVLNAGALPVNLTTQSVVTVSATLGKESLQEGLIAGLAGLVLLALYLLFYYRLLALVAWLGMTIWAILALALISVAGRAFGYTLTLAGVAGLVISLGVTADSYIVFFERLKDEVRHGKSPRAAVQPAFKRAYKTIVAADVVTGLAAIILYLTAISSVRGFALTLGVATALDLFVVYFFKRPTVFLIARSEALVSMHGFGLTSGIAADEPVPVPVAGGAR